MTEARGLIGVIRRAGRRLRHLSDEELLSVIESALSDPHLETCERCAIRHAELLCAIADLDVFHGEADAAFDEERLLHQRTHILRRLDRNHGPARVLPFPAAVEHAGGIRFFAAGGRRWIAAAAIGGLLVGIFSGRIITQHRAAEETSAAAAPQLHLYSGAARRAPAGAILLPAELRSSGRDEILLEEIESAVAQPRVRELSAIDAITPAAR